jgi:hypothetical protein
LVALLVDLPKAQWLLGERGYDAGLVQGGSAGQGHRTLHPRPKIALSRQIRQALLQAPQPRRDQGRSGKWISASILASIRLIR